MGREIKAFNVKDGYIISHLKKAGIIVGIITSRDSKAVSHRAAELKLDFCHQGIVDKYSVFEKLIAFHKLKKKEVAYIGDDINDFASLAACGLSACPADAMTYVRTKTDVVTQAKGGQGVLREVADLVLSARGEMEKILKG
jgi:3-deoxy-D-manno-octulosonate 8-phosphate phosphatase (KDO 8-P phosphatase)